MGVLKNELSKQLDEQYRILSVFADNFESVYEYCKNNYEKQSQLELIENVQINLLDDVVFYKDDNGYILDIFDDSDYDCYNLEVLERLLNMNLEQNDNIAPFYIDTFIYEEACYKVLEDDWENDDLKEKYEKEIEEAENKLWEIYLNNIKEWNEELNYIYIRTSEIGNEIIGTGIYMELYSTVQKIIYSIEDTANSVIFRYIAEALDCVYDENPKQYYSKNINEWKEELDETKKSIENAEKYIEKVKKQVEDDIDDIEGGLEEYGWLIEE